METTNHLIKKYRNIIGEFFSEDVIIDIISNWNEPHRHYHNINHLLSILKNIDDYFLTDENEHLYMGDDYKTLIIAAFFHDVVYDPKAINNEDNSIEYFLSVSKGLSSESIEQIVDIINVTKSRTIPEINKMFFMDLKRKFWLFDNSVIYDNTLEGLIDYEHKIFKEYQFLSYDIYKAKRIEFLKSQITVYNTDSVTNNINFLINYIKNRKIRVGVYSGSFNPFHLGHLDVLEKANQIFDKVIIAYGNNPEKEGRIIEVPYALNYYQVDTYTGLVTDYIKSVEDKGVDVTLIRGLRNGADLDYESNQLAFIKDIKPDVKVVYIPCDKKYEHISSSAIRNLSKFDSNLSDKYLVK